MAADLPRESNAKSRGRRKEVFATAEQPEGAPGVLKPNSLIAEKTRALPHRHGNSVPPRLPTLEAVKLFPQIDAATPPEYNSQQVLSMPRHYQLFRGYNWKIFPRLVSPFFDQQAQIVSSSSPSSRKEAFLACSHALLV